MIRSVSPGRCPVPVGLALGLLFLGGHAHAQGFNSGSDGSLGDVVISTNTTLDLPPDGKLNFKSLTVNSGATLTFNRNARNTPAVILAQTQVVVDGTINVDGAKATANNGGLAGPGGFDGGKPGFGADSPPSDGYGPGGGRGGVNSCGDDVGVATGGGFGTTRSAFSGPTYGNTLLIPIVGGSGGGGGANNPTAGGGGGGGAVLIAANNRIAVSGSIFARGGNADFCLNGGSGGAIRLVAFRVEGAGSLDTQPLNGNAGVGRIRVDTVIRTNINFRMNGVNSVGGNLLVFPPAVPTLSVVLAAGNAVPLGSDPLTFTLPFGSDTNQTVRIQAQDFGRVVPLRVTLTPDSGNRVAFDAQVDNTTVNPATVDVPVTVPVNTVVTVHCWTR